MNEIKNSMDGFKRLDSAEELCREMEYVRVNMQTEAKRKNFLKHTEKECKSIRGIGGVLTHIVMQSHIKKRKKMKQKQSLT